MTTLSDVLDQLEQLITKLLNQPFDDAFLDGFDAQWRDAMELLDHLSSVEHLDPVSRESCRHRLEALIGLLPQAEEILNKELSETARLLSLENKRSSFFGKATEQNSGRFMYRKA